MRHALLGAGERKRLGDPMATCVRKDINSGGNSTRIEAMGWIAACRGKCSGWTCGGEIRSEDMYDISALHILRRVQEWMEIVETNLLGLRDHLRYIQTSHNHQ